MGSTTGRAGPLMEKQKCIGGGLDLREKRSSPSLPKVKGKAEPWKWGKNGNTRGSFTDCRKGVERKSDVSTKECSRALPNSKARQTPC